MTSHRFGTNDPPLYRESVSFRIGAHVGGGNSVSTEDSGTRHGAFMAPSGRNQWQPVANGTEPKPAQLGRSAAGGTQADSQARPAHLET